MDEEAWVERTSGQLALTLADPSVRAELLTLLAGTKDERERQRRLETSPPRTGGHGNHLAATGEGT